jgi:periplasmic divalent cation tolerance protein
MFMSQPIEIHWSSGSIDEARKVSRYLVQERLVACAQITPWIESIFLWNNQIDTAQESKIILKTCLDNYEKIKEIIQQNCAYELPEITFTNIDGGNQEYLTWINECVTT